MIRLWAPGDGARVWLARMVQSPRTARAACILAGLLLVAQTARAVIIYTREQDLLAQTRSNRAVLREESGESGAAGPGRATGSGGASNAAVGSSSPILRHLPADDQPGLLLSDLMAILDAAGIETYRYRLLLGASSGAAAEVDPDAPATAFVDRPIEELLPETETGAEQVDDLVPLELAGVDIPPPPPGIKRWELALHVRTSYARLIQALRLLEADERIWDVPRVSVYRANEGTEADLRLATYGQAATSDASTGQARSLPAQLTVPAPAKWPSYATGADPAAALAHDPFREGPAGTVRSRRVPPRLGAIRLGAGEAAWLDGQAVRPGESVGEWTLLEIHPNEVLVRHVYGSKHCIRLNEPPGREAPNVQP